MVSSQSIPVVTRRPPRQTLMIVANVCFIGTLLTDLNYWRTAEMMWTNFSAWLLFAGLVMGVLAVIAALIDFFSGRLSRERGPVWPYLLGSLVVLVLSFFNSLVHSRDAWTSVVPTGLTLSAVTVIVLLVTGLMRWAGHRTRVEAVE